MSTFLLRNIRMSFFLFLIRMSHRAHFAYNSNYNNNKKYVESKHFHVSINVDFTA